MSPSTTFPGGLSELEFLEAYWRSALRKPQMAADAALRQLVFAEAGDRAVLTGLIAQELAESCRRLTAVHAALADRRFNPARALLQPLPNAAAWTELAQRAAILTPEQMVRELSLSDAALSSAVRLRSQPDLAGLTSLVRAAETGNPMVLVPGRRNVAIECWLAGVSESGEPVAASFGSQEQDAANLADLTAEFSGIARGFLGAYLDARKNAGWRRHE